MSAHGPHVVAVVKPDQAEGETATPANANSASEAEISPELARALRRMVVSEVARALDTAPQAHREGMNADDVAVFLGVDRKTVYDYANRGRIPHQRLGKRLLFSRSALVSWLGACKSGSADQGE